MNVLALPKLLTESEAAEQLGVSVDTMQRERKRGRMPFRKIGGRIKYTPDDLLRYIERAGENQWDSGERTDQDNLENIGSAGGKTAPCGAGAGSTPLPAKLDTQALAREIFKKPRHASLNGTSSTAAPWMSVPATLP